MKRKGRSSWCCWAWCVVGFGVAGRKEQDLWMRKKTVVRFLMDGVIGSCCRVMKAQNALSIESAVLFYEGNLPADLYYLMKSSVRKI